MIMKHLKHVLFAFAAALLTLGATDVAHAATEVEDNGTSAYANPMALNEVHTGILDSESDVDWYSFTTTEDGILQFVFAACDVTKIRYGWSCTVYDENMKVLDTKVVSTATYTSNFLPRKAGTFYLKVQHYWEAQPSEYALCMMFTPTLEWEAEENGSSATAKEIVLNATYKGILQESSDIDWYKFKITKNGYFNVTIGPDESSDVTSCRNGWKYSVYDKDFNMIYSDSAKTTKTSLEIPYAKGDYSIKVEANGSYYKEDIVNKIYNIKVTQTGNAYWEKEKNDSEATATPITLNKLYKGRTTYSDSTSNIDYYKFEIKQKSAVKINFDRDETTGIDEVGVGWKLWLWEKDDDSTKIYEFVKGNYVIDEVLAKGTYYFVVGNNKGYTVPQNCLYNIKVSAATIPAKPTGVTATAGTKKATIKWNTAKNATTYYVMRSDSEKGKYTKIATVKDETSYTDSSVKSKKTYYYKVIAVNSKNGVNAKSAGSEIKSVKIK